MRSMCFVVLALLFLRRPRSFIGTRSPFLKKCVTRWRDPDDRTAARMLGLHQSAIGRILPDGKSRAGGAPRLHRFLIGTLLSSYPFQEIEDQIFNCVDHISLNISIPVQTTRESSNRSSVTGPPSDSVPPVNRLDARFSTHLQRLNIVASAPGFLGLRRFQLISD